MNAPATFPGHIYDQYYTALTPDAPELTQDLADTMRCRSLLCDDDVSDVSLILILNKGAHFDAVPPFHLEMVLQELRRPRKSVMLLSVDPDAEESIRDGLLDRLSLETMPAPWMGRA